MLYPTTRGEERAAGIRIPLAYFYIYNAGTTH